MPKQVNNVQLIDVDEENVEVVIGPHGFTKSKTELFGPFTENFRNEQIKRNMRLSYILSGKPDLTSSEYLNTVNKNQNGMECADRRYFIKAVNLVDFNNQTYEVLFSHTKTGPAVWGFEFQKDEFETPDTDDVNTVTQNIASSLRIDNHTSLTNSAINSIKNRTFRF